MVAQGLDIWCWCNGCCHHAVLKTDMLMARLGRDQAVPGVADHAYCGNCGSRDVETRPNWPTVGVVTQHPRSELALGLWYDFNEVGWHLGNVGLIPELPRLKLNDGRGEGERWFSHRYVHKPIQEDWAQRPLSLRIREKVREVLSPMIRISQDQIMVLIDADWLKPDGAVRLNGDLSLTDLQGSLILNHARLVLSHMEAEKGVKLTSTGNFNRKFVEWMVQEFDWPGYEPGAVWRLNKILNEPDFLPLHFIRVALDVSGLTRKHKGTLRISRLGRTLLAPDAAGELLVVLFYGVFQRYNLGFLDRRPVRDNFQPQIGLTLFLMSRLADEPCSIEELVNTTISPLEEDSKPFQPKNVFQWRVLRYLEWFGLMEKSPSAANDEWASSYLYCKSPLYDRFLSFNVEIMTT